MKQTVIPRKATKSTVETEIHSSYLYRTIWQRLIKYAQDVEKIKVWIASIKSRKLHDKHLKQEHYDINK